MEFDIEEIRKLREEVETLRRDIAQLNGRLDIIECVVVNLNDLARALTVEGEEKSNA